LLVFDFRLVTGIDSSAMHSFTQIKQLAGEIGAQIVLVNLTPELRRSFALLISSDDIIVDDLDHALELCEDIVIEAHSTQGTEGQDLVAWLTQALGSAEHAFKLTQCCERLEVQQGDIIAAQGEPAECMHFIVRGRVGIVVNLEGGISSRVRSLGSYTTVGEMGLITGSLRSATIQAEADSVLYVLSRSSFDRISRENPLLSQAFLTYVITVMADRLRFASNLIGVLRR
jgi:SulP family sulfate permease